jgi:hypothetical protein
MARTLRRIQMRAAQYGGAVLDIGGSMDGHVKLCGRRPVRVQALGSSASVTAWRACGR